MLIEIGAGCRPNAPGSADVLQKGLNIDGVTGGGGQGIQFNSGASLTVFNCTVRHFSGVGIDVAPATGTVKLVINGVVSTDNGATDLAMAPHRREAPS